MTVATDVPSLLAAVDVFSGLDAACLGRLADAVELCEVPGGTVLMRQGEAADFVFVVLAGRLQARVRDGSGEERSSATWDRRGGGGECVINGEARTATVVADRNGTCLRLSVGDFDRLAATDPALLRPIAGQIVSRMRRSGSWTEIQPPPVGTVTLVPLDSGDRTHPTRSTSSAPPCFGQVPDAVCVVA